MKVTTEPRENRQLALTIEVDPERVEKALAKAAKKISREANIPGFRKGKAPRQIIEQMFGKETVLNEALDELGQQVYAEALEQEGIEPYGPGSMEDMQSDPLILNMLVPLPPEVDAGDYRDLREPFEAPPVNEEDVEHQIGHLREKHAMLEPASEDASADWEHLVTFDIDAKVEDEEFANDAGVEVMLEKEPLDERVYYVPDFEEQIIGIKVDEEKTFSLPVPDDADKYNDFAGKTAEFTMKLTALQKRTLPDADDALAQTVGDFETVDELRDSIRKEIAESQSREAENAYTERVIDKLLETAKIDYPPQMIEIEIDEMIKRTEQRMGEQGLGMKQYLEVLKQSEEEYRESVRPSAEARVQRALLLGKIVDEEKLKVEDTELDAEYSKLGEAYERIMGNRDTLPPRSEVERGLSLDLLTRKAVERLAAIAKGEAPELDEPNDETETEAEST